MFRDFSFDAASRHSYEHQMERAAMNVSPTSTLCLPLPRRLPTPPCSIGDLALALDQQSLHITTDLSSKSAHDPLTPPSDDGTFSTQPLDRPPQLSTLRLNSATLRMQRQANVRMLSSASHIKDISTLVEDMIKSEDQCHVVDSKSLAPPSPTTSEEDEGVDMDFAPFSHKADLRAILSFHRADQPIYGCARVSKTVRMRKQSRVTKRLSK